MPLIRVLFICLGLTAAACGRDIYVAATGSDTTGTGTLAKPYREIRKALTVLAPGESVLISDGSYKGFDAVSLGSATTTTTIRATGPNVLITPTTDRGTNNPHNMVAWLCTNVVFEGLTSSGATTSGMRLVECNHVTVRGGSFTNNGKWGIVTSHCVDLVLENNVCSGSVLEHGIYVANSGDGPVVRGNRIHGNANSGLRLSGDANQGGDGLISGAVIENNIIYDNGANGGGAMNLDGLQDSIIRNNLIYNNRATGIALFKGLSSAGPTGVKVLNNTIIVSATGRYCLRITDVVGGLTVRNNILYNLNTARGQFSWNTPEDAAFTDSDYNLFGGGRYVSTDGENSRITMTNWIAAGHEPHSVPNSVLADLFLALATDDYRLTKTSAATNAGTELPDVSADLLGVSRPQGAAPDIGAYEYSPFAAWKATHTLPLSLSADSDSDQDGTPLLVEYALGLHPGVSDSADLPAPWLEDDRLNLSYPLLREDVTYLPETSTDLQAWTTEGVTQTAEAEEVTASVPVEDSPRFLRLRVLPE